MSLSERLSQPTVDEAKRNGIPAALFIEDVADFLAREKQSAEEAIYFLQDLHRKYKFLERRLLANKGQLKGKIPDILQSLDAVRMLKSSQDSEEGLVSNFQLCESLYVTARIKKQQHIGLWLGANVMMEYTLDEAEDLLSSNLATAQASLIEVDTGLSFAVWRGGGGGVAFGAVGTGTTAKEGSSTSNTAVTYSTELEVSNEDLSLRPGMTATVDIAIVDKKDILVVPNSALRFDPVVAASIGKPDATKRTLVQSLSPGGGRRWRGAPPPKAGSSDSTPKVWILKEGEPYEIPVTPGITDGKVTEITGGELTVDMPVIISIKPPKTE
jgi:multidrug efflux pump subunit AcrA (membrane-fusion protein)